MWLHKGPHHQLKYPSLLKGRILTGGESIIQFAGAFHGRQARYRVRNTRVLKQALAPVVPVVLASPMTTFTGSVLSISAYP